MSTKSVDFNRAAELGEASQARKSKAHTRWSASGWLYIVLAFLVVACLTFAAVVWSILLSPIN